ncbi:MAG: cytochrome c3 family protein, partial [Acidobacteriota bacterium]
SLAAASRPQRLSALLAKPFVHALSKTAFSEDEPGAVTCTSCHSPHRGMRGSRSGADPPGRPRLSPKDPARFEYELCESCHGSAGVATQSLVDISRLLNPTHLSDHPVEAPSFESSPSVIPSLTGRQINCTDCHGNSDAAGVRGPHGSDVPFILRANYLTLDGNAESPSAYALCYTCHRREAVLNSSAFPEHGAHIIPLRASCATCHNAHGSVTNRALVRFGEETVLAGVAPSARTGRLAFVSDGPGTGACYLTCHGYDHAPEAYGGLELFTETASDPVQLGPVWIRDGLGGTLGGRPVKDRPSRLRPPKRRPKH